MNNDLWKELKSIREQWGIKSSGFSDDDTFINSLIDSPLTYAESLLSYTPDMPEQEFKIRMNEQFDMPENRAIKLFADAKRSKEICKLLSGH